MKWNENLIDVNEILTLIETALEKGVKDRHSDYHTFSVATSKNNITQNRTVVLRDYDSEEKIIRYHTNYSTQKIKDININDNSACVFYSKKDKVQIRINGISHIDNNNSLCNQKWNKMNEQSKLCYFQNISPGEKIESPEAITQIKTSSVSKLFTVITIKIKTIDWLFLSRKGHKRVIFTDENQFKGQYIAP